MWLRKMEEYWTTIELKTWYSKNTSGFLEARVGGKWVYLGTFAAINDKVFWHGKKTVIHWIFFTVGGNFEPWVIETDVLSVSGYVRRNLLNK